MKKSTYKIILFLIGVMLLVGCSDEVQSSEPLARTEFLMDTVMTVRIYDKQKEKTLDKVFDRLKEIEQRMSITIETSDVNKINNNAGTEAVKVNEDTYFVLETAKDYANRSNGAYDPTIAPLVDLWNIKSDEFYTERESLPTDDEINLAKSYINYDDMELLEDNKVLLKNKNMSINLGSIVKGYAADEVKRILAENGVTSAIIDLGGNIYAMGSKIDGSTWNIGLQDPFQATGVNFGLVKVSDKSIVTSGDYERYIVHNDKKYHHILDQNTGYPVENEVTGITIISDKSIDGDALSTTLFVLGVEEGLKFVEEIEGIDVVFITKDKSVYATENIKSSLIILNSEFNLK